MTDGPAAMPGWLIVTASFGYLTLLFAIAYYGDRRAERGRSLISNPTIYALSIAVYCTAWTFYGSVGRAANTGLGFLPIYLGPTLAFALGWLVLRKILRISKTHRITTIADFISSRYGKSHLLGGLVSIIAVIGIMPYISLQLKAVSTSFTVLVSYPETEPLLATDVPLLGDTALWVAALMALFAILFGTRHIDASEHHEGMVVAIAFESLVKLLAFGSVGVFVTFGLFNGFGDIFARAEQLPDLAPLLSFEAAGADWLPLTVLAMFVVFCLPRQFHVTIVENVKESHLNKAIWQFPLYLLLINLFVLPVALGGLLLFPEGSVDADTFVLALPLAHEQPALALFAFIGGLSAATGMVIVETVALTTMVCNDLIMPLLLKFAWLQLAERRDLSGLLLGIRRVAIVFIMLIGYLYFRLIGETYALVSIGLMSFAAAAQFGPAMLAAIYWRSATRRGAIAGISAGFVMWTYTLLLPSFAQSGWLPLSFVTDGPFGFALLQPQALLGMTGLSPVPHALFWSLIANFGALVAVSLADTPSTIERIQATLFVEANRHRGAAAARLGTLPGRVPVSKLIAMSERFLGRERTGEVLGEYARNANVDVSKMPFATGELVQYVERRLSGAIGSASARVMIASTVQGAGVSLDQIMQILDETSQVLEYSRQLEQKSKQLENVTTELKAANEQLREVDRLKDDLMSTVTHELRTPLTSIRSFSEILHDSPDLDINERQHFLSIIIRESERLTRLINQVLDLTKIETGKMKWQMSDVDLADVIEHSLTSLSQLFEEKRITIERRIQPGVPTVRADRDQMIQLVINLLSNAQKFVPAGWGRIVVSYQQTGDGVRVSVADNGPGIPEAEQTAIFEKFHQVRAGNTGNPGGSGLGLAICRGIVEHLGGRIWVESTPGEGSTFIFTVPFAMAETASDTIATGSADGEATAARPSVA
ncbi:MAG: sensor histidine kinase [Rhodospirillales bacterium]|jgi:Na+/proline symporter/nitrogen-specific signal transduction histidine kinase|nr:sensor histidine kinase [Rhodospirillales bacterium]